jgi:hypothetical protein
MVWMGHTALILNKRLLGRKDVPRQGGDNRIEVVLSILIVSDRATGGSLVFSPRGGRWETARTETEELVCVGCGVV